MLRIKIIVVDRTRASFLREGELFYLKRLRRYARMEWVEVKPAPIKKGKSSQEILAAEGDAIARRVVPPEYTIALDRSGKTYDSMKLAAHLQELSLEHQQMAFLIGGPLGLSEKTLEGANEILSLSKLTLTHEMSRLLLLEQLYRALTILRGEKYHK